MSYNYLKYFPTVLLPSQLAVQVNPFLSHSMLQPAFHFPVPVSSFSACHSVFCTFYVKLNAYYVTCITFAFQKFCPAVVFVGKAACSVGFRQSRRDQVFLPVMHPTFSCNDFWQKTPRTPQQREWINISRCSPISLLHGNTSRPSHYWKPVAGIWKEKTVISWIYYLGAIK